MPSEALHYIVPAAHPLIKVSRRPARYDAVQSRIDEIGTGLKRLYREPFFPQGRHDAEGHCRLAAAAVRARDQDARHSSASSFIKIEFSRRERTAILTKPFPRPLKFEQSRTRM